MGPPLRSVAYKPEFCVFFPVTFPPHHHGLKIGCSGLNFGTLTILSFPQQAQISPTDFKMTLMWLSMINVVTFNEMY